jgi:hypothetical protein
VGADYVAINPDLQRPGAPKALTAALLGQRRSEIASAERRLSSLRRHLSRFRHHPFVEDGEQERRPR